MLFKRNPELRRSYLGALLGFFLFSLFLLAVAWEFKLESVAMRVLDMPYDSGFETAERWRFVLTSTSFALLSMVAPLFLLKRLIHSLQRSYNDLVVEQAQSESLARHDPLSGLLNRRVFHEQLAARLEQPSNHTAIFLVDLDNFKIINDTHGHAAVEPTPAHRTAEVESTKTMIERVEAQFDIKPERLIGDTAYGTAPMLAWMVEEKDIEPHVPVWDKTERKNDSFSSNDFYWNEEAEEYRCPAGNPLRSEWRAFKNERSHVTKANTIIFRSRQTDCATCPMKAKCCPNTAFRKIARSVHEAARDVARRIAATPVYQRSRHERKKVEMLFAHLKRILKLDRLRLRGMSGATDEFTLAAAVQNLRRLAKFSSQGPPVTG